MRLTLGLIHLLCRYSETITVGEWDSFYYILLVGVCVRLTLGLLPLPCRYSETITVGEWVASIKYYW